MTPLQPSTLTYRPWDREEKLGPPPWKHDDPKVVAWVAAHGHDVRLKCYPELGCQLVEQELESEITTLCKLGEEMSEAGSEVDQNPARLEKASEAWDEHMEDRFQRAIQEMG